MSSNSLKNKVTYNLFTYKLYIYIYIKHLALSLPLKVDMPLNQIS